MMTPEAVRLFGSKIRGDDDSTSDTDILIVSNDTNSIPENIDTTLKEKGYENLSYSLYGKERIIDMFKTGHLFAWHLYYESKPIFKKYDFITELGEPHAYTNALNDIIEFEGLIAKIPQNIKISKFNAVYESGILYICARNIALCASMQILEKPCYSRYSPFEIASKIGFEFPLSTEQYDICYKCRREGMQGVETEPLQNISSESNYVLKWIHKIKGQLG